MLALVSAVLLQANVCDMKKVEDGVFCDTCKKVLLPAEVVDREFCKVCNGDKKGEERTKGRKVKVCSRTYYTCPDFVLVCEGCRSTTTFPLCPKRACREAGAKTRDPREHTRGFAAGKCKCGKAFKAVVDKSLVMYLCTGCNDESEKNEPCTKPKCKKDKLKRQQFCSLSGTYPHCPENRLGD